MAPDKTVPLPRTAVSETNIELSTQLNGWTLGRVCWVHVSDPIRTDCLLTLTSCPVLLPAIREGEDSSELLEKTLLKLRQDQKGSLLNREWLCFYTTPIPVISDSYTQVSSFFCFLWSTQSHFCAIVWCGTPTPGTVWMPRLSCRCSSHTCRPKSCCSTREPDHTLRASFHTQVSRGDECFDEQRPKLYQTKKKKKLLLWLFTQSGRRSI